MVKRPSMPLTLVAKRKGLDTILKIVHQKIDTEVADDKSPICEIQVNPIECVLSWVKEGLSSTGNLLTLLHAVILVL